MDPIQAQETSERDQLWASLRLLQPEIDRLAAGDFDGTERQNKLIGVLAQIVTAEIKFRARESGTE
jgi:hypothetical protein